MSSERDREAREKTEQGTKKKKVVQVAVVVVVVLHKRVRLQADVVALAQETQNYVDNIKLTGLVEL